MSIYRLVSAAIRQPPSRGGPLALWRRLSAARADWGDYILGVVALLLYSLTLSPGLLPADAGEYQLVGATLGVAHPPGFALYTLTSWLISRWSFAPPATTINFLSAVLAAGTLTLVSRFTRQATGSAAAGLGAASCLGFSTTFWAQAVTANIRMPAAFAIALALERCLAYRASRKSRSLAGAAFALGLGISHHGSLAFIAAVLALYLIYLDPSSVRRPWPWLAGSLPFLFWLYFPLRAGAVGAPAHIATTAGFLEHILARGFRGDMFYFANCQTLPARLTVFGDILTFEFTWPILLLAGIGIIRALKREFALGLALLTAFGLHSFVAITYKAPQTVEYLLPAYVLLASMAGFGFAALFRLNIPALRSNISRPNSLFSRIAVRLLAFGLGAVPLLLQFAAAFPSYMALARENSTRAYATSIMENAPPNSLVLAGWHWATPLWYLQHVEHRRPDIEVRYVFPRSASLAQDWIAEINAALPQRPVVVTNFHSQEYSALPYRFLPLGEAWLVQSTPLTSPPAGLSGGQRFSDSGWEFLGYHLDSASSYTITLQAAWRALTDPQDISFYVHLLGTDGRLYGQMDVNYPASRYIAGEVLFDLYTIYIHPDTRPGTYTLAAGAYRPDGRRLAEVTLTTVTITARNSAPPTLHPIWGNLGNGRPIGWDIDQTLPATPRLYLHWRLGPRPITVPIDGNLLDLPAGNGYLTTALDLAPSQAIHISGYTLPGADGGLWPLALGHWPTFIAQPAYLPFGHSIIFAGCTILPAVSLRPGQTLTLDLYFLAAHPLTQDYAVKIELLGNGWRLRREGTPAEGAMPTLKWIGGSRLVDRHMFTIPADAAAGPAQLSLTIYDSFTQRPLPVLDSRLVPGGPAVTIGTIEVVAP